MELFEKADEIALKMVELFEKADEIALKMAQDYDNFLYGCFAPFGITSENLLEYKDRISIIETGFGNLKIRAFYLDKKYIFTITIHYGELEITSLADGETTFRNNVQYVKTV